MQEKRIALVSPFEVILCTNIAKIGFSRKGISLDHYEHAIEAIEAFNSKKYPLIISTFEVAPGDYDRDVDLKSVFEQILDNGSYANVGLHLVRRIKQSDINKDTPIIVADMFDSTEDSLYENVEKRSLEVGADLYFSMWEPGNRLDMLIEEIEKRAKWC